MDQKQMLERCIEMVEDPDFKFGYFPTIGCEYGPRDGVHDGCLIGRLFPAIKERYPNGTFGSGQSIDRIACTHRSLLPELADSDLRSLAQSIQDAHDTLARQERVDIERNDPTRNRRAELLFDLKDRLARLTTVPA